MNTQCDREAIEDHSINRTPGRLVVGAIVCLLTSMVLAIGAMVAGFTLLGLLLRSLAALAGFFFLPLLFAAIISGCASKADRSNSCKQ